jgi:hypothetical protein
LFLSEIFEFKVFFFVINFFVFDYHLGRSSFVEIFLVLEVDSKVSLIATFDEGTDKYMGDIVGVSQALVVDY